MYPAGVIAQSAEHLPRRCKVCKVGKSFPSTEEMTLLYTPTIQALGTRGRREPEAQVQGVWGQPGLHESMPKNSSVGDRTPKKKLERVWCYS